MNDRPLCVTTNSPSFSPLTYNEGFSKENRQLWSSEESCLSSFRNAKDIIYNAEKVQSDDWTTENRSIPCSPMNEDHPDISIPVKEANTILDSQKIKSTDLQRGSDDKDHRSKKRPGNEHSIRCHHSDPPPDLTDQSLVDHRPRTCRSLDCLKPEHTSYLVAKPWTEHCTSSSEDTLASATCIAFFPLIPWRQPVTRRSTPPGLPPFGTQEAQELRLTLPSRSKLATLGRKVLSYFNPDSATSQQTTGNASTDASRVQRQHASVPADMLKRMLGMARPVPLPTAPYQPGRSKLPKGVQVAATTGALIQAEDGTYVRGRWGPRFSGHGIGQRSITVHPLARLRDSSAIHDAVREIDKAHDREQRRARPQRREMFQASGALSQSEVSYLPNPASMPIQTHGNVISAPMSNPYHILEPRSYSGGITPQHFSERSRHDRTTRTDTDRDPTSVTEKQKSSNRLQDC